MKLIPPSASKYLLENKDYDNFEFRSPINPWKIEEKYKEFGLFTDIEIRISRF